MSTMPLSNDMLSENSRIVQPSYLEKAANKKELVRRLRQVCKVLGQDGTIEPGSSDWPGLAATATLLLQNCQHKDKEVRLYAVLGCMETFAIYAPESPYDDSETLDIFRQMIQQIGNLAHTTQPTMAHYPQYARILALLAQVKIGCVLVEITKINDDDSIDLLVELVHALLHLVRNDHPSDIVQYAQNAVIAILDEYNAGAPVPVPLLDEVLLCIGQGPTVLVANPAFDKAKKTPLQVEQSNPCYTVAKAVLKATLNRIATPVAQLLNGLLDGGVETSSIPVDDKEKPNVYDIVYELHNVAPQILTTVIGTVSHGLHSPEVETRQAVTNLLGRLFANVDVATKFRPCFREYLGRQNDVQVSIRRGLVAPLVQLLQNNDAMTSDVAAEANQVLVNMLQDSNIDVRQDVIYKVCDSVYRHGPRCVTPKLLQAVGKRVSSKFKEERKNALTGLAQLYFRHFIRAKLEHVHAGGDDCEITVILKALHETCHLDQRRSRKKSKEDIVRDVEDELYGWIPRLVFESVYWNDEKDTEMRSRVVQIVDEILLGSDLSSNKSKHLTPTARAVGLAMILDSLRDHGENLLVESGRSAALKFLVQLMEQRARLQKLVGDYVDARSKIRDHEPGSEAALVANAKAILLLEKIAVLTAPPQGKSVEVVLEAFHGARDKHIFRILSTIADPLQKLKSRDRALDELPKRTKSLGDAVCGWVKSLARRCNMGDFINEEIVGHCVLLAQECYFEKDIPACAALLACVRTAAAMFPDLCSPEKTFQTLKELFSECLTVSNHDIKKEVEESGIMTCLSALLSSTTASSMTGATEMVVDQQITDEGLQADLFQLCTRDGTPEQARNAVYALARLLVPDLTQRGFQSPPATNKHHEALAPLLKALSSPSRLTVTEKNASAKVVSTLSALAALSDCAPQVFISSERGQRAIKFAIETVLLGRSGSDDLDDDSDGDDDINESKALTVSAGRKERSSFSSTKTHLSPESTASLLEDEALSIPCRRLCASIDFLASCVRASILSSPSSSNREPPSSFSIDTIRQIFEILSQILRDNGLPPSNRDRRSCKARQDRAALRQMAATHLLRLCDKRLGLESKFLTITMWHALGTTLLDEERVVREAVVEELRNMLVGTGVYCDKGESAAVPALRFVSMIALCSDGDHGTDHDAANGNAANLGRISDSIKFSANFCIGKLRKSCEALRTQCRAAGPEGEKKFETRYKTSVLPEYAVPLTFHLLAHRRETPAIENFEEGDGGDAIPIDEESQHRVLKKRLKLLFDPIVASLGEGGDNISFLLRMTQLLGKSYCPVDVTPGLCTQQVASPTGRNSIGSSSSLDTKPRVLDDKRVHVLEAKLKSICLSAREVLLSYVKKDVDLSPYPGTILIPPFLFKKTTRNLQVASQQSQGSDMVGSSQSTHQSRVSVGARPSSLSKKRASPFPPGTLSIQKVSRKSVEALNSVGSTKSRVHFSPEVEFHLGTARRSVFSGGGDEHDFGLSPIAKSGSPDSMPRPTVLRSTRSGSSADAATLGTTPPSGLRSSTMRTTIQSATQDISQDGMTPSSNKRRSPRLSETRDSQSLDASGDLADDDETRKQSMSSQESEAVSFKRRKTRSQNPSQWSVDDWMKPETQESCPKALNQTATLAKARGKHDDRQTCKTTLKPKSERMSVPKQIKINRIRMSSTENRKAKPNSRAVNDLDFDFDDTATENKRNRGTKAVKKPEVSKVSKATKTASKKSRSLRTRG